MTRTYTKKEFKDYIDNEIVLAEQDRFQYGRGIERSKKVLSYDDAKQEFRRCRNVEKGRRLSQAFQIMSDNGQHDSPSYTIDLSGYGSTPFIRITSDNVFEFVATNQQVWQHSQSIVTSIHNWLPFQVWRHRKGLYRVSSTTDTQTQCKSHIMETLSRVKADLDRYYDMYVEERKGCDNDYYDSGINKYNGWTLLYERERQIMKDQPSYFQGLKYDGNTGKLLNQRPDDKFVEKPEERKAWRKALTLFKRGVKARAKVGAFKPIIDKVYAERQQQDRYDWKQPDWSSGEWLDLLESCIRNNKFPAEFLTGVAMSSTTGYYQSGIPTNQDVIKAIDTICDDNSIELRRRFNVFEKEGYQEPPAYRYGYKQNLTISEVNKVTIEEVK